MSIDSTPQTARADWSTPRLEDLGGAADVADFPGIGPDTTLGGGPTS